MFQLIKFCAVGLSNTVVGYVLYLTSLVILKQINVVKSGDYYVAQIASFSLGVLWAYYWNRRYVFEKENEAGFLAGLLKSYMMYGFTGVIVSNVLLFVWIEILEISEYIAPIFNLAVTVPLNFMLSKFWVFR